MSTTAPAPAPAVSPAPVPVSAPVPSPPPAAPAPTPAPTVDDDDGDGAPRTVPLSRLREQTGARRAAEARATSLEAELAAARAAIAERDARLEAAETTARRASIRQVTNIDDDEIADMLHRRYEAAQEGLSEKRRVALSDWWTSLVSDEQTRAALPRALRHYADEAAAKTAPRGRPGQPTRAPGQPGGGLPQSSARTVPPEQTLTPEALAAMPPAERRAAAALLGFRGLSRMI